MIYKELNMEQAEKIGDIHYFNICRGREFI